MLLVGLVYFVPKNKSHVCLFIAFEPTSYFVEKFGLRLKRGVLRDECEYGSEIRSER